MKWLTAWRYRLDLINNFLELGTERPCVHEQSAADAAGNAFGKFQTRVAFARRLAHQLRHGAGGLLWAAFYAGLIVWVVARLQRRGIGLRL